MFHKAQGGTKPSKEKSAPTFKPAGSGSRPVKSKHPVMTSAPKDSHKLDGRSKVKNKPL